MPPELPGPPSTFHPAAARKTARQRAAANLFSKSWYPDAKRPRKTLAIRGPIAARKTPPKREESPPLPRLPATPCLRSNRVLEQAKAETQTMNDRRPAAELFHEERRGPKAQRPFLAAGGFVRRAPQANRRHAGSPATCQEAAAHANPCALPQAPMDGPGGHPIESPTAVVMMPAPQARPSTRQSPRPATPDALARCLASGKRRRCGLHRGRLLGVGA